MTTVISKTGASGRLSLLPGRRRASFGF